MLTSEQRNVISNVVSDVKSNKNIVKIGGYGGTGKSTIAKFISDIFKNFAVCAYTGKASSVLNKKGMESTTIHSRIYIPEIINGVLIGFDLADKSELNCSGFLIDESSMVPREIHYDLLSYNLPIIYIGDHGQLEPVGTDFNLMAVPDYCLEKIHRNAGEIPRFAEHLRKGRPSVTFRPKDDRIIFKKQSDITDDDLINTDQIICAYNATRVHLNKRVRSILGYNELRVGDRVMCLRNNKRLCLFNGMQGVVKNVYRDGRKYLMDFEFDNTLYEQIEYDIRFFNQEKPDFGEFRPDGPTPFDYAYCCTCHKSQGDEFENVLVFEQKCKKWEHKRWAYTAASRTKNQLQWAY